MIKLDAGNVLLKPSQRRRVMTLLRRCQRLGQRLGDFVLNITLRRTGRCYEVRATVHDRLGDFACRSRQNDWRNALRDLARALTVRLQGQRLRRTVAAS